MGQFKLFLFIYLFLHDFRTMCCDNVYTTSHVFHEDQTVYYLHNSHKYTSLFFVALVLFLRYISPHPLINDVVLPALCLLSSCHCAVPAEHCCCFNKDPKSLTEMFAFFVFALVVWRANLLSLCISGWQKSNSKHWLRCVFKMMQSEINLLHYPNGQMAIYCS